LPKNVFTFTEYGSKAIQSDLGWGLNDPRLDQLERLNNSSGNTLFTLGRKTIKASQFVGLVRLGDTTLQILPKIAAKGDFDKPEYTPEYQDAVRSAMHNMLVMLSVACDLPLRAQDAAELHSEAGDWLEILTRLFALELHRQFKAGLPHAYVTIEDRLPVIRGSWLIGKQLAHHSYDRMSFDVSYDEFSPDTPLNRTFSLTVDTLWRLTQDPINRRLLLDLRDWLADCKPSRETLYSDLSKVYFTRLNERFNPAFNLARLFWEQRLVQLSTGSLPSFSFVFDMNRLFQDFIAHFLKRHHKEILQGAWLDGNILLQAQGQKVHLAERTFPGQNFGKPVFQLIPDILLLSPLGIPYLIADTKYKRLDSKKADGGVAEGDMYQMLAYTRKWKCSDVLLLYPSSNAHPTQFSLQTSSENGINIRVVELNLHQPLEKPAGLIKELRMAFAPDW
jgi:5-methylcytosine-specific restriction enzyme subunit McrC